jgi:pseudoazurin
MARFVWFWSLIFLFSDNLFMRKFVVLFKNLRLVFMIVLFGSGLLACGDDDTAASEKPAVMATANNGGVEAYDPDVPSMVVEDNGVVSEEEIYKNWPAEVATVSGDAATTEQASETSAADVKTHTVLGQATSFNPKILFINPGDTVQWENMTIHDSVSMEGLIPEGAKPWKFNIGQNGAVTLTEEGVYIYKCNPHYPLGMVAAIIVGKPVNVEQVQSNATGRSKGIVIKVVKALAAQ